MTSTIGAARERRDRELTQGTCTLYHFSATPLGRVRTVKQDVGSHIDHKPRGLWLSDERNGDGWFDWCSSESFGDLTVKHEVEVDLQNLIVLRTIADIDEFHDEFGVEAYPKIRSLSYKRHPDWNNVSDRFDGILITPYQWGRRLDGSASDWYYSWDCASACIWNSRSIRNVKQVYEYSWLGHGRAALAAARSEDNGDDR